MAARCMGCRTNKGARRKRGLCEACYMQARRMMATGEVSESKLVELGRLAPRKRSREGVFAREVRRQIAKTA